MPNLSVRWGCYLTRFGAFIIAVLIVTTPVRAASITLAQDGTPSPENAEPTSTTSENIESSSTMPETAEPGSTDASDQEFDLRFNNPGSITERLDRDEEPKEYLFQFPGVTGLLKPWYDMKANFEQQYGLRFGISYTALYKDANNTFGEEDDASGFDLDISGTWTMLGRDTDSPTMLGFNFFYRDDLGTDLVAQRLFTQFGGLYSTAAPYGDHDPVVGEFYLQKKFNNVFGFRVGQIFPITAYDFFPFKNFRTDFIDFNHVTNNAIPLPGNGLGALAMYRPHPQVMLRLGVHDANADVEKWGGDTYEGELFSILEVGYDTGLLPRNPGGLPQGHVHVSLWHQDKRSDFDIGEGWGIAASAVQRFGRFSPFLRYGYTDSGSDGPSPVEHMANVGLVIDGIFGQANDRIGIGFTWSDPSDRSLDHQEEIDAYYRVQLTPEIQISPTLQVVFDPVRHPDEDTVYVWGIRSRIEF